MNCLLYLFTRLFARFFSLLLCSYSLLLVWNYFVSEERSERTTMYIHSVFLTYQFTYIYHTHN